MSASNSQFIPQFPDSRLDDFYQFIGVVPGDKVDIHIESNSFLRIFVYKTKSEDPVLTVNRSQ